MNSKIMSKMSNTGKFDNYVFLSLCLHLFFFEIEFLV